MPSKIWPPGTSAPILDSLFFCPSCTLWRTPLAARTTRPTNSTTPRQRGHQRRAYRPSRSPLYPATAPAAQTDHPVSPKVPSPPRPTSNRNGRYTSATAVHTAKDVSPAVKELYEALEEVKDKAGGYVHLARLGLAIRGLEAERGEDAVIRVAGTLGLASLMRRACCRIDILLVA